MCQKRKGFTLIEMLVVIAIIAVLMTLLMPSLSRARARALSTVCLSNLSQHTRAAAMYVKKNSGKLPDRQQPTTGGGTSNWALCSGINEDASAGFFPTEKRQLNKYLGVSSSSDKGVNLCSSERGRWLYGLVGTSYQYNTFYGPGYSSNNSSYITLGREGVTEFMTQLSNPSIFVIFSEIDTYTKAVDGYPSSPHMADSRYNIAFIDGHANRVTVKHRKFNTSDYTFIHQDSSAFEE